LDSIFIFVENAIHGSPLLVLSTSFLWGILSVLLSPCHLACIPLIVAFIKEQKNMTIKYAFNLSIMFSLGILVTIALLGVVTVSLGRIAGDLGRNLDYFVAFIFIFVGLYLIGVIPINFNVIDANKYKKKGILAAFLFGLFFGIALGPCTFAYMAPIIAVSFKEATRNIYYSFSILILYGLGHCLIIALAGTFSEYVFMFTKWNNSSKATNIVKIICGILIIIAGIYSIYKI